MPEDKDNDGNGAADDKDQKDKVSFNDDQQVLLQKIVDAAYTKAFTKAEEKWKATTDSLTAQVDELKKKPATPEVKPDPKKADDPVKDDKPIVQNISPDYAALAARLDEVQGVANNLKAKNDEADQTIAAERKKNKEARIKEAFFRSADKIEFFDRMDVFALTQNDYDLDDAGEVVIINAKTKQPRISGADPEKNMSLDQFLGEFAKSKPNMVRAKNTDGGSGAGENRSTEVVKKPEVVDYNKMTDDEFRALTSKVISRQYTQRS